ncbi:FAD-dependent oxidoreductase [Devosia sp. FJ2-5-3]|uniref:FAD-dependent oxidoreductase n=1 Tax=Devosia sp. FJ2-5-3 TaxID=2976680 RepID=UPI0023D89619|nr:FAD-dependent oxidoreductase [Devosia sp. FJ2-5-3]WEJ58912.1 FAD-dependent oxidoreductase [Devosia sp. FJ2-5-3]
MSTEKSRVSRRGFMKAAGLGAASTALGAVTVTSAQAQEWDEEFDVVVAGSGGAALAGAIGALDNGASVVVLEKAAFIGGTTGKSGGGSWVPNNRWMEAHGYKDNKEDFLRYVSRVSFPELYRDNHPQFGMTDHHWAQLNAFWDNAARVFHTLNDEGALPVFTFLSWDGKPAPDYHGQIAENNDIRGRQIAVNNDGQTGFGAHMIEFMSAYVEEKGGDIRTENRVSRIIKDDTGRVVGVEVDTPEGTTRIRAKKGVIFGTGGFTHNHHMRTQFLRTPVMGGCAVPTNEGDLINMSAELGVKLGNLNEAWNQQVVLEEVLQFSSVPSGVFFQGGDSSISVNKYGKRMYDEKYVYPERTRSHQVYDQWRGDYPNLYQIFIFDEEARKMPGNMIPKVGADLPAYVITGNNLEELTANIQARFDSLAEQLGTYKLADDFLESLKATIERYNGFAIAGKDEDFHRGEAPIDAYFHAVPYDRGLPSPYMAPIADEGPYYAVLLGAGTLDTKGGPVFDVNAQVLNVRDEPIPGLYVAGNASASPSGKSYLGGGGTLGLGITFGYIAGEHAAKQA